MNCKKALGDIRKYISYYYDGSWSENGTFTAILTRLEFYGKENETSKTL